MHHPNVRRFSEVGGCTSWSINSYRRDRRWPVYENECGGIRYRLGRAGPRCHGRVWWGRWRRRDGRYGTRTGRRRAVEENPAEHVHQVGQRAPEDGREAHREPGDRPQWWTQTHHPHRGAVGQEAAETQQETLVPVPEAGKRIRSSEISSRRRRD